MSIQNFTIDSFNDFLDRIEQIIKTNKNEDNLIILYRGQSSAYPLLPGIARDNASSDSTEDEKSMLKELKRRSPNIISKHLDDDWDWLVYAQHYGMKTRLLDWTTNPLTALWFAISDYNVGKNIDGSAYIYLFVNAEEYILNKEDDKSPFKTIKTRILKPAMNNERIVAQSGWFTAHKYSTTSGQFVSIEQHGELKDKVVTIEIPAKIKFNLLEKLNLMGVNYQSLFPEVSGICQQINWEFMTKKKEKSRKAIL